MNGCAEALERLNFTPKMRLHFGVKFCRFESRGSILGALKGLCGGLGELHLGAGQGFGAEANSTDLLLSNRQNFTPKWRRVARSRAPSDCELMRLFARSIGHW